MHSRAELKGTNFKGGKSILLSLEDLGQLESYLDCYHIIAKHSWQGGKCKPFCYQYQFSAQLIE